MIGGHFRPILIPGEDRWSGFKGTREGEGGGPRACPVSLSVGQLYQTDWYDRLPIKWKPATCYFPDTLLIVAEGRSASFSPHPSSLANLRTRNKVFTPCRGAGKAWTEIAGTFDIRILSTDKSRKIVTFFRFHLIFISLNGYSWKGKFSEGKKIRYCESE